MDPLVYPVDAQGNQEIWKAVQGGITSDESNRSPELYLQILAQFGVTTNARYLPKNGATFCNIFAGDVTDKMGALIPHWILADGTPKENPGPNETEENINADCGWLEKFGAAYGWTECTVDEAKQNASEGRPTAVVWFNPKGHGHVGMVRPAPVDLPAGMVVRSGVWIAQAGATNYDCCPIEYGFGPYTSQAKYFKHA